MQVVTRHNADTLPAGSFVSGGISAVTNYGPQNDTTRGTVHSITGFISIFGCGDATSEHGGLRIGLNYSPGTDKPFPTTTPGRAWVIDATLEGPITNQANLLTGLTMAVQNKAEAQPSGGPSVAIGAMTTQGWGGNTSTTYPFDYGVLVCGHSGSGSTAGFNVGVKVGGFGTGWMSSGRSILEQAAVFEDWRSGLKIWKRQPGGTQGAAVEIGYDGSGAPSTAQLDGLRFGGDAVIYRFTSGPSGPGEPVVGRLSTGVGNALRVQGFLAVNPTNGTGYVQVSEQSAPVGAVSGDVRIHADNGGGASQLRARFGTHNRVIARDVALQTYTVTNPVLQRTLDVGSAWTAQVAAVLGTLIADLKAEGRIG